MVYAEDIFIFIFTLIIFLAPWSILIFYDKSKTPQKSIKEKHTSVDPYKSPILMLNTTVLNM